MDFLKLCTHLGLVIKEHAQACERTDLPDEHGAVWHFQIDEEVVGFAICDDGEGTLGVPTVSISLVIDTAESYSRDDLLDLLSTNMGLLDAAVCATPSMEEEDEILLLLQHKVTADNFDPESFPAIINRLEEQMDRLFGEEEYEEGEWHEEDEEEDDKEAGRN